MLKSVSDILDNIRMMGAASLPKDLLPIHKDSLNIIKDIDSTIYKIPNIAYPEWIVESKSNELYSYWGRYIDCILRRIIDRCIETEVSDYRCNELINGKCRTGVITLSNDVKKVLQKAYNRYKDYRLSTRDTLLDIWIVSISSSIWYLSLIPDEWYKYNTPQLSNEYLDTLNSTMKSVARDTISIISSGKSNIPIVCDLNLTIPNMITANIDLLVDDCIIEFKCSKYDSISTRSITQLMMYTSLIKEMGISKVNRICIMNPILGILYIQDISSWNEESRMLHFIKVILKTL